MAMRIWHQSFTTLARVPAYDEALRAQRDAHQLATQRLKSLSPREREVFRLLARGSNNAQIVAALDISLPTAKQYKSEVMRKLELDSLVALIEFNDSLGDGGAKA